MAEEADVGIVCYTANVPGFRGVLKQRYTDFIVNEVDCDGKVVHLTCLDVPTEEKKVPQESSMLTNEVSSRECQLSSVNSSDYNIQVETFKNLVGESDAEKLKDFLTQVSAGDIKNLVPLVLSPDPDKAHRAAVHNFFKANLSFLMTDTIKGTDPSVKCVRVRYYNKQEEHGRNKGRGRQGDKKRKNREGRRDGDVKRGKCDASLPGDLVQVLTAEVQMNGQRIGAKFLWRSPGIFLTS